MQVGSIVRASRNENHKGRAMVATVEDETVTLLWEDSAGPSPIQGHFIVAPMMVREERGCEDDDAEVTMLQADVMELLEFETNPSRNDAPAATWKDRGDHLLRLGDPAAAIPFYEMALRLTNNSLQVGCTVLFQKKERVFLAEVDCLDATTADLTLVDTGAELVVQQSEVLLSLSTLHSELQLRVLLNLARSLMQWADYDASRPYRASAVLSTSMAYAITTIDEDFVSFQPTCLMLRSRANASQGRYEASMADVEALNDRQARQWKAELLVLMRRRELTNKKLVKGMCQWIGRATNSSDFEEEPVKRRLQTTKSTLVSVSTAEKKGNHSAPVSQLHHGFSLNMISTCCSMLILIAAYLYQAHNSGR
jgi:hypothetical protein